MDINDAIIYLCEGFYQYKEAVDEAFIVEQNKEILINLTQLRDEIDPVVEQFHKIQMENNSDKVKFNTLFLLAKKFINNNEALKSNPEILKIIHAKIMSSEEIKIKFLNILGIMQKVPIV